MKLSGKLSIGYPRGGDVNREVVSIEIKDAMSGCTFAAVEIEYVEWARALSSLAFRPCEIQFYEKAPLGKVHQHKTELVMIPVKVDMALRGSKEYEAGIAKALKPYVVDGWEADMADTTNWHRRSAKESTSKHDAYRVSFHRYVDPPADGQKPEGAK